MFDDVDSSDDENINYLIAAGLLPGVELTRRTGRVGSILGKRPNAERQFEVAYHRLLADSRQDPCPRE